MRRAAITVGRGAAVVVLAAAMSLSGCVLDRAPGDLGLTPPGPGARVRFDLGHRPLPEIPLPNDVATWPDPTSRTGLRINASLVAPTAIERQTRGGFADMEGWGTFAPLSVSFDVDVSHPDYADYRGAALDLRNVEARHQGDDYDFADDAVYLLDLETGVPQLLDLGAGNFSYTVSTLDAYWPNDPRGSERNLLFETIDETSGGAISVYDPARDSDFDGALDRPNLDTLDACPDPHPQCDSPEAGDIYETAGCRERRQERDRCIADHLLTWYERETDTLLLRPLLPLREMRRYAVVLTDRLIDGRGNPAKSPFEQIFHATQRSSAERVQAIMDDPNLRNYFGDLHGTGLNRVAFLWSFTTQPTVDDLLRLRDGLYGEGPFGRWAAEFAPVVELQRSAGLTSGLAAGATDQPGWATSEQGVEAGCPEASANLFVVRFDALRDQAEELLAEGFGLDRGPGLELLLRRLQAIDRMVIGTYRVPFLLEDGPRSTAADAAFRLDFASGRGEVAEDVVQLWLVIPKETASRRQPFDVNIYGHGHTGHFAEMILYAGNMAEHGLATVGINAAGHGLVFDDEASRLVAKAVLGSRCHAPFFDALTLGRARDLNRDGVPDSGGDFWSSYLFHTRDMVRQSVLDHIQLVRLLRSFGTEGATMRCRDEGDPSEPVRTCDLDGDGSPERPGDFDADGVADVGGPDAAYGTWGESLGGILSAIHGAIDPHVTVAVPGSGGGGLADMGVRAFRRGVVEAVLLRLWGPLLVTVPADSRAPCTSQSRDEDRCTVCDEGQLSLRWVVPDANETGEVEIRCLDAGAIADTTVLVRNLDTDEVRCASVDSVPRLRVGLPATEGDRVVVTFWNGRHRIDSYGSCRLVGSPELVYAIETWGPGRFAEGATNGAETARCGFSTCAGFQGVFYGQGTPLVAPGSGLGYRRQTPSLRRFLGLAQAALEPADPISFAPLYALRPAPDPFGRPMPHRAVLTLNTIGDTHVPVSAGIAFARATGALPLLRPDQRGHYPEYGEYVTPQELFDALGGRTPNRALVERHVIEGIASLARHPAAPACADSANLAPLDATYLDAHGDAQACYPTGCTLETEVQPDTRICPPATQCTIEAGSLEGFCSPRPLGPSRCEEALWDVDDVDEGEQRYFEQLSTVPHRLARLSARAAERPLAELWAPRLQGRPGGPDADAYRPTPPPQGRLTALLDAYLVPEGQHAFVHGEPCQAFDHGTYLTNLVARFLQTDGTDLYYLSHPASHHCLATQSPSCDYAAPPPGP